MPLAELNTKMNDKIFAIEGIIGINKENKIIVFNEAASRITGFQSKDAISKQSSF